MKIKIQQSNQAAQLETQFLKSIYCSINTRCKKSQWIRLTGLGVGILTGGISVLARIASIGENLGKGLINVLGSPFSESCRFRTGLKQLTLNSVKHLAILPFTLISAIAGVFIKTFCILVNPQSYSYDKWCENDPAENEKKAVVKDQKARDLKAKEVANARPTVLSYLDGVIRNLDVKKSFLADKNSEHSNQKNNLLAETNETKKEAGITKLNDNIRRTKDMADNTCKEFVPTFTQIAGIPTYLYPDDYKDDSDYQQKITEIGRLQNEIKNFDWIQI